MFSQLSPLRSCLRSAQKSTPPNFNYYSLFTSQSLIIAISSPISSLTSPYSTIANSVSSPIVAPLKSPPNFNYSLFTSQSPINSISPISSLSSPYSTIANSVSSPHTLKAIRSYSVYKFRSGKVAKLEDDNELIQEQHFKYNVEQRQISDTNPDDPVIELAFFQSPALDVSLTPRFRVHSLLAGCVEEGNKLVHLIDDDIRHTPQWPKIRDKTAEDIGDEVEAMGITVDELKEFWFDDSKDAKQFWSKRFLKHHRFSYSDCIPNYIASILKFAKQYLLDNSLGNYLAKKGFETGKYYNSDDFLKAVDEYFNVKTCVRYTKHGTHPSVNDILVLLNKDGNVLRDHPFHDKVANGKFLFRDI